MALVLQIITKSDLGKTLIFKGGTALHHCYLEQYRFSEDLDFSANQKLVKLEEVRSIFANVDYLQIKKDYLSQSTVKIERLQYSGPLKQANSLKVEIDFFQNVVLPPQSLSYSNVWGLEFDVGVMDIREICAEKIRAMSGRARYRDFFDMYLVLDTLEVDLKEVVELVKRKEIREPITKANIKKNWEIVLSQREKEMSQIYYSKPIEDTMIENMINALPLTTITL